MDLLVPDYVVIAFALGGAVWGLFIGFSGALAFLAGAVAAVAFAKIGWPISAQWLEATWGRIIALVVADLLVFGLVRMLVRRVVKGLVAQPGDALLGSLSAAISGLSIALTAIYIADSSGYFPELRSVILDRLLACVG